MKNGDWYNAKLVEDTVEGLQESAGLFGYAFADVNPQFNRDKEALTMSITFDIAEASASLSSVSTSTATPSPRTRSSAANSA
jgi:outer membrane protein assembly factor BamA